MTKNTTSQRVDACVMYTEEIDAPTVQNIMQTLDPVKDLINMLMFNTVFVCVKFK